MKTKAILAAFIMAALIGSSIGVGYAGSGGAGGPGGIFLYQCFGIDKGAQQPPGPPVLDINDQFTNTTTEQVGKLKLVCTLTDWDVHPGSVFNPTVVDPDTIDHLTCYELPVNQAQATPSMVTLTDAFGVQTVTVTGQSKYVCVGAHKECLTGCPVVGP